jgi:hypothetical protein
MKTFIAVLLLSTSSLAMAGEFYSVPNPYEQRPTPNYGNDHDQHERTERERYEKDKERERYDRERKTQENQPQRYSR